MNLKTNIPECYCRNNVSRFMISGFQRDATGSRFALSGRAQASQHACFFQGFGIGAGGGPEAFGTWASLSEEGSLHASAARLSPSTPSCA